MTVRGLWTATTTNKKTDNVPTLWIGATREESKASCGSCPLLKRNGGKARCYAQHGTPAMAHAQMVKSHAAGKDYGFAEAMAGRWSGARMARFGAIGDPVGLFPTLLLSWVGKVRELGLSVVGYTHRWREAPWLRGVFMASCDTLEEADVAADAGWRVAVVLERGSEELAEVRTPAGRKVQICPAQVGDVRCNSCRLCDASKRGPMIGFIDHGPTGRGRK